MDQRYLPRRANKSLNEFAANIRRLSMEFENGKPADECMAKVLESIREYDRGAISAGK